MISDWGNKWIPNDGSPWPYTPNPVPPPQSIPIIPPLPTGFLWTQEMLDEWRDIIGRVRKLEERLMELGDRGECVEDPSKGDYLDEIQALLDKAKAKRQAENDARDNGN